MTEEEQERYEQEIDRLEKENEISQEALKKEDLEKCAICCRAGN